MSKPARCHRCAHRAGPRSTAPMAKADKLPTPHEVQPKKAPCVCDCHPLREVTA